MARRPPFWPNDLNRRDFDEVAVDRLHGSRQAPDTYLLALAVERRAPRGEVVTLDLVERLRDEEGV